MGTQPQWAAAADGRADAHAAAVADGLDEDEAVRLADPTEPTGHTVEKRRGPSTLTVALGLLLLLLTSAVASDPTMVLPRDSTILVERHEDRAAGISLPTPVGWQPTGAPPFGSTELVPESGQGDYSARILLGPLSPDIPAASISDDRGAATALAETIQEYVLGIRGERDEQRDVDVRNKVGDGHATSFVVTPDEGTGTRGGLVYVAVFGTGSTRSWLAYVSETPSEAPEPRWVDRIVHDVVPVEH